MKRSLKIILFSAILLTSVNTYADMSYWLAHKMVKKGVDIPSLFKSIPEGSIVTGLPRWIPKVCDFKYEIAQFESSIYSVASCVYIGKIRSKS